MAVANATGSAKNGLTDMLRTGSVEITCGPSTLMVGRAIETSLRANIRGLDVRVNCQPGAGQPHLTLPGGKEITGFFIVEELKRAAALANLDNKD